MKVYDHAFHNVPYGREYDSVRTVDRSDRSESSAAVAVEHSAEIELRRLEKTFHFGVEKIHERSRGTS